MTVVTTTPPRRRLRDILIPVGTGCLLLLCLSSLCIFATGGYIGLRDRLGVSVALTKPNYGLTEAPLYAPTYTPYPTYTQAAPIVVVPPPATTIPSIESPGITQPQGNAFHLTVPNPTAPDQQQIPHPAVYQQTQVSSTPVQFTLDVPAGYYGIVGGFSIDNTSNGVYRVLAPGQHVVTITDGFAEIIRQEWGLTEWNFRIDQAVKFGWAHNTMDLGPLK